MSVIPIRPPREIIRAFCKIGYEVARQKGSHVRLKHPRDPRRRPLSIPNHHIVKPGLLSKAIKQAGLTVDEFIELLKQ
jgi:predicted RNA binding protein YcfA (HicA-like mRNA interferase family)